MKVRYVTCHLSLEFKTINTKMSSVTSNFTNVNSEKSDNLGLRTSVTTAKKKYIRRKILQLSPLRLDDLRKELEEDENEAPPEQEQPSAKEGPNNSFDLNFKALSITPQKVGDFATPRPVLKPQQAHKVEASSYDYITPKNKVPLKVQCSVNMQPYLKTPIDRLCNDSSNNSVCDLKVQKPPAPVFRKIKVNQKEYIVLNQLGKGGSSEVFHCYNVETKSHHAIKCISLQNAQSASGFINEVNILNRLQNCNRIIRMFDFEINQRAKTLLVILEVGGSDLSKILKEAALNTNHMPLYMLLYYWMEMLYAVQQIHSNGIIHSDLKPANFLKVEGYLKLIDFGIASCVQNDMTSVIKAVPEGSYNYISPEALNNESSSNTSSPSYGKPKYKLCYKSDVWSLGCILYQLVYGKTPFQQFTKIWVKFGKILDPNYQIDYPDAPWVPQKIINTIKKCLQHSSCLRPSVEELILEYENVFQNLI